MSLPPSRFLAIAAMTTAVAIYGAQFVTVRLGFTQRLSPYDMSALRFIVAGAVMLPVFLRAGARDCAGIGWGRGLVLAVTGGLPMSVISNIGLLYAPAAHGSAIQPGLVAVTATALVYLGLRQRPPKGVVIGFAVVLGGLGAIAAAGSSGAEGANTLPGDLLFAAAGALWGVFTWLCGRWQVPSATGTAVVSTLSLAYLPVWALLLEPGLHNVSFVTLALHGINQGIFNVVLGLLLWTYGARVLGVPMAARFPPLIPVFGTLFGIPVLGEVPSPLAAAGVCAIMCGLLGAAVASSRRR